MSKSEVQYVPPPVPAMPFGDMTRLALAIAKSGLFGIKNEDQALALMALAQAEGRHPATVARDYHIIGTSPAKKAEAMQRDFLMAGGKIEWLELTDEAVEATFSHPIGGTATIRWDSARCKQAGLISGNHAKFPRQMKRSRVVSEGVRTVWPLATSGMYESGEVADFATPTPNDARAELDAFAAAKPAEIVDAETGEVIDISPFIAGARIIARQGWNALKAYADAATDEAYEALRPLLGTRNNPGELRLIALEADRMLHDEPQPHSPAGNGNIADQPKDDERSRSGGRNTDPPAGDDMQDLLGGEAHKPRSYRIGLQDETAVGWEGWKLALGAEIDAGSPHAALLRDNADRLEMFAQVDPVEHNKIMRALEV